MTDEELQIRQTELPALNAAADYLAECCEWSEYDSVLEQIEQIEQAIAEREQRTKSR